MQGKNISRLMRHLIVQVFFWTFANIFLLLLIYLVLQSLAESHPTNFFRNNPLLLLLGVGFGCFQGVIFGLTDSFLGRNQLQRIPIGFAIIIKGFLYFLTSAIIIASIRFLYDSEYLFSKNEQISDPLWRNSFKLVLIYDLIMSLFISFINQVNRKFGSSTLRNLLSGKYVKPKEELRVFLFLDLKSSTSIAESLGHIRYSAFVRDFIFDINRVITNSNAQIYQYVGDEIVVTWYEKDAIRDNACINFFFECEREIARKSQYYLNQYGIIPEFKAGAHNGKVTTVEIGDQKRDIAFHGDVLNTAARLQSICNAFDRKFLISESLASSINENGIALESLGEVRLRGKNSQIGVFSVNKD